MGFRRPSPAALLALTAAWTVLRARGADGQASRPVRVVGVVFDSLLGVPLAGATVTREGRPAVAFTDAEGRFVLDGVAAAPGRFVFSHPALDSAGLADVPAAVDLTAAGERAEVRLATPSRATLLARACGAAVVQVPHDARGPARDVLVFGAVRDATTARPVAGAAVRLAWLAPDSAADAGAATPGGLHGGEARLAAAQIALGIRREVAAEVRTDDGGLYAVCVRGPAADLGAFTLRAARSAGDSPAAGALTSGSVRMSAGVRGVVRQDLLVGAAARPVTPAPHPAVAASALGRVEGLVRSDAGRPIVGARVRAGMIDDSTATDAVTDAAGRFRLADVPLGTQPLVVRAIGYAVYEGRVDVRSPAPPPAEVVLANATRLADVEVRAARRLAWRDALWGRLDARRTSGRGAFLDTTRLRNFAATHQAIQGVRGMRAAGSLLGARLTGPDNRRVVVVLDGILDRSDRFVSGGVAPEEVAAVEVYAREGDVPPDFSAQVTEPGQFSLVAVWTRDYLYGPGRTAQEGFAAPRRRRR